MIFGLENEVYPSYDHVIRVNDDGPVDLGPIFGPKKKHPKSGAFNVVDELLNGWSMISWGLCSYGDLTLLRYQR